jgi:hypothetical protein
LIRRSTLLTGLACIVSGIGSPGAPAAPGKSVVKTSCGSGRTLFRHGAVRAFLLVFHDSDARGEHQQLLACRGAARRPLTLFDPGPFNVVRAEGFRLVGSRLGFVVHGEGFANGSETDLGYVDFGSRRVRRGLLNAGENAGPGDPLLPEDHIGYAIAPDGAVAAVAGSACQVILLLRVRTRSYGYGYRLGPPVAVFTASDGGIDPASIGVTAREVTWRSAGAAPGSAPRPPDGPAPTLPADRTGGC